MRGKAPIRRGEAERRGAVASARGEQAGVDRDVDDRAGRVRRRTRLLAPPGAWRRDVAAAA